MTSFVDTFAASVAAARAATEALPTDPAMVKGRDGAVLMSAQAELAAARRNIDASAALIAGEIAHQSRPELGYSGLAQREGFRTAEALVQHQTGSTAREASTLVTVGGIVRDALVDHDPVTGLAADGTAAREPWLSAVGAAVNSGALSVEAARSIRTGLGNPSVSVTADDLAGAALVLVAESPELNADRLLQRARDLRDELDAAGIADRERAIHEQRAFRRVRRPNGVNRYIIDPDLESGAFWDDLYDKLTSPRRGGPRFVEKADREWADAIAADQRTTEQYVHDAVTQLLRIGVEADTTDSRRIIGSRLPAVRVLTTADALATRTRHGRIEGTDIPVSIGTVERIVCTSSTVIVGFDDHGQALNLGREQRLFTGHQRIALAARDGGCRWPGCERPPSWTEAHHVQHWIRDRGKSNIADGILLCRHHHMLLHNNHWEIERHHGNYWLIPPPDIDHSQKPRPMPTKSAALRDLQHERDRDPDRERLRDTG